MICMYPVGPPSLSAPQNLTASNVTDTTVFLQWDSASLYDGNRFDLLYIITENISNSSYSTTDTRFLLENLIPFVCYEIRVMTAVSESSQGTVHVFNDRTVSVQIMTMEGSE